MSRITKSNNMNKLNTHLNASQPDAAARPAAVENAFADTPTTESEPASEAEPPSADAAPEPAEVHIAAPVFYDDQRRRWSWFLRIAIPALLLLITGVVLFVVSLIARPLMPETALPRVSEVRDFGNPEPLLDEHGKRAAKSPPLTLLQNGQLGYKQDQDKKRLAELDTMERKLGIQTPFEPALTSRSNLLAEPIRFDVKATESPRVVAGFYVSWDEASRASTRRNIDSLTHFIPEWLHLKNANTNYADPKHKPFVDARQTQDRQEVQPLVHQHNVPIIPLLNNFTQNGIEEGVGKWDAVAAHKLLSNPAARTNLITHLRDWLKQNGFQGINIDFEEINTADRDYLTAFMRELYAAFHPVGLLVTQDVQVERDSQNLPALARANDWLVPMVYDEHEASSEPGSVAGIGWTQQSLHKLLQKVPADKVVMGVGNHGYDWTVKSCQQKRD